MTTFSKTTAFALVAIFSLNAVVASAQTVETPRQPTQGTLAVAKHYGSATLVVRAQEVSPTTDQDRAYFDLKWPKTRTAAPTQNPAADVATAPTISAAPVTPVPDPAPCGPVALGPNGVPLVASSTC
jgi:uncharacterized membrane protein